MTQEFRKIELNQEIEITRLLKRSGSGLVITIPKVYESAYKLNEDIFVEVELRKVKKDASTIKFTQRLRRSGKNLTLYIDTQLKKIYELKQGDAVTLTLKKTIKGN